MARPARAVRADRDAVSKTDELLDGLRLLVCLFARMGVALRDAFVDSYALPDSSVGVIGKTTPSAG